MFNRLEHFYNSKPFVVIVLIRIALFLGLAFLLFIVGLMIGYSVLGGEGNPFSVFSGEVWQKIFDFVRQAISLTFIDKIVTLVLQMKFIRKMEEQHEFNSYSY